MGNHRPSVQSIGVLPLCRTREAGIHHEGRYNCDGLQPAWILQAFPFPQEVRCHSCPGKCRSRCLVGRALYLSSSFLRQYPRNCYSSMKHPYLKTNRYNLRLKSGRGAAARGAAHKQKYSGRLAEAPHSRSDCHIYKMNCFCMIQPQFHRLH